MAKDVKISQRWPVVGALFNEATSEMISCVLSIEEFSVEDCEHLQSIFQHVTAVAPGYFSLPSVTPGVDPATLLNPVVALHENVDSWLRFSELTQLFGLNLQGIADRWSDGKGPLAMYFKAEEVRSLVTSMFENTSKRRAFLKLLGRRPSVANLLDES